MSKKCVLLIMTTVVLVGFCCGCALDPSSAIGEAERVKCMANVMRLDMGVEV